MITRRGLRPRAAMLAIWVTLPAVLLSQGPPKDAGSFCKADLVELTRIDSTIRLDIPFSELKGRR